MFVPFCIPICNGSRPRFWLYNNGVVSHCIACGVVWCVYYECPSHGFTLGIHCAFVSPLLSIDSCWSYIRIQYYIFIRACLNEKTFSNLWVTDPMTLVITFAKLAWRGFWSKSLIGFWASCVKKMVIPPSGPSLLVVGTVS